MNLRAILQRREAIRAELRGIIDQHPDGLPDEVRARCDELEKEATTLNDQEKRQAFLDDLDRRANGTPLNGGSTDRHWETEARSFSTVRAIGAAAGLPGIDAG